MGQKLSEEQIAAHWRTARKGKTLSQSELRALYEFEADARGYENTGSLIFSQEPIHDVVLAMVRDYPCSTILDAGCGPNPILDLAWMQSGSSVVALEYCFGFSRYAYRRARANGRALVVINGDVSSLPFRSNSFDGCVCTETLEHTLEPSKALSEIRRVLKRNGRLFLTVPNENSTYAFYLWLLCFLMPWKQARISFEEHPSHLQHFSRSRLYRLFSGFFEIERSYSIGFSKRPFLQQPVEYALGKIVQLPFLRSLSGSHAFVLRVCK